MILGQVKTAVSGPARQTINSDDDMIINGLSIDFTPISDNSLIIVKAIISNSATYVNNYRIYKNGQPTVTLPPSMINHSTPHANTMTYFGDLVTSENLVVTPVIYSENSENTIMRTYDVRARSWWGTNNYTLNYTLYINNRESNDMASFSYFKVMEFIND